MRYKLLTEPDLKTESVKLLAGLINDETMAKTRDTISEKYGGGIEDKIHALMAETIETEKYVSENINYNVGLPSFTGREAAEFLFKTREAVDNFPASVFYFHEKFKETGITDKFSSILVYIDEERLSAQSSRAVELPEINNGAEMFARIDSCNIGAEIKYEAYQIYYRFDEYYEYFKAVTEQAVRLMEEKLYLFKEKLECFNVQVGKILSENGSLYLKEKWGVEIGADDGAEFIIRPAIYLINGITLTGLISPESNHEIHWGISIIELTDLINNASSPVKNLPEFLKVISDGTKRTILQLLKKEPLYGGQLAEQLNLTGATISHHMDALKKLELILYRKESTKLYYSLNNEMIKTYLKVLKKELI